MKRSSLAENWRWGLESNQLIRRLRRRAFSLGYPTGAGAHEARPYETAKERGTAGTAVATTGNGAAGPAVPPYLRV